MLVLVGGSASGKSTIERILCEEYGYKKVTSYTTRSPRIGEKDGVDYHFITTEEFKEKQKNCFFAEVGEYNGWFYGSAVEDCTNDKVAVLTPHGMRQLRNKADIDIFCVYIKVPRRDRLIKILQRNDNIEEAKRRDASDVGQFDGIEDEADCIIENKGYNLSPDNMAKYTDRYYSEHLVDKNKICTILCDIDEVVNNLVERLLVEYNRKYNDSLNLNDITKWEIKDFLKPECENIFKEFGTDDFLFSLGMQPKAKEVIEKLMEKYKFYFVTSTYPDHVRVKDEWLKRIFPKYNSSQLIICHDKHLVHGDILIDDCSGNFIMNHSKDSPVKYNFIFDKPWNRDTQEDNKKTFRVHGWEEIYELINKLEEH